MTFSTVYCLSLAAALLALRRRHVTFVQSHRRQWTGRLPRLSGKAFEILGFGLVISLIVALVQPIFLALAAPASLLYFRQIRSLSEVRRKANTVPLVLGILGLCNGEPDTAIVLVKFTVCQVYFSAAYEKWRASGWAWTDGQTLATYLWRAHLIRPRRRALWLAQRVRLCSWLSQGVLLLETAFPAVLLFPSLGKGFFLAALAFHSGSAILLRIHYLVFFGPALLVLLF